MTMKKIYVKPFMKEHKLLHTNNLLGDASQNYDMNEGLQDGDENDDDELIDKPW